MFDKNIKIMVGFRIFTERKNKQKVWIHLPINSIGRFPVNIKVDKADFDWFPKTVALACSNHFDNTGPVILNSKAVFWWGSIPNVTDWKESDKNELHTPSGYAEWLNTACQAKKKSIGLEIKMHDPAKAKKQAVKEDLLAKQEARAAAMKEAASKKQKVSLGVPEGRGGDGDEEGRIQSMFCTIGSTQYIFIQEILKGILLTLAAVQVWAADLMARKDGKIQASEASPLLEMVTQFFGELQSNSGTAVERNKGLEMATHPPNDPTSPAYHNFLGIPNREHVLEVLESNGFTSHGSFRSSGLAQSKVSALGLNLSTVTALFDHTTAIDNHLLA
ncbi:hypothetical protein PSTT_05841 [Puccinia striiformis]|uniref:Uncharacterized protein n=1 Tax=Puccinia striiformis TaxID=27350 RepID=A0A2S4VMT6_9BASI|nr:hypothetical protein PSTT_05841 [Puccinia striiformis]